METRILFQNKIKENKIEHYLLCVYLCVVSSKCACGTLSRDETCAQSHVHGQQNTQTIGWDGALLRRHWLVPRARRMYPDSPQPDAQEFFTIQ